MTHTMAVIHSCVMILLYVGHGRSDEFPSYVFLVGGYGLTVNVADECAVKGFCSCKLISSPSIYHMNFEYFLFTTVY